MSRVLSRAKLYELLVRGCWFQAVGSRLLVPDCWFKVDGTAAHGIYVGTICNACHLCPTEENYIYRYIDILANPEQHHSLRSRLNLMWMIITGIPTRNDVHFISLIRGSPFRQACTGEARSKYSTKTAQNKRNCFRFGEGFSENGSEKTS